MNKNYIAVDWGSTHLRAWQFTNDECVNTLSLPYGVSRLGNKTAQEIFARYIAPWRNNQPIPVMMAGMIGSEAGWEAVPYLSCPVSLKAFGSQRHRVAGDIWIVPGVKTERNGACNVMRGEETQLLGAAQLSDSGCFVLPGTHCKWVQVENESIRDFTTSMTGELHHLLLTYSLIGKTLPEQQTNAEAFRQGLETGLNSPSVLPTLFETRARRVLGKLKQESVSDYLSGVLIGAEVATLSAQLQPLTVTLVGGENLLDRYQMAFESMGISTAVCPGDRSFLQGIERIVNEGY
ncbi:TPA: 2-dehydro-3-deoxygalactonokinase [Enterobacter hormaechei subsp. steigerwaltii]|nr:2-dehydro-3-deoxygalactonokinase [Enterobacter hormaechei subsp. steigerwaltii]